MTTNSFKSYNFKRVIILLCLVLLFSTGSVISASGTGNEVFLPEQGLIIANDSESTITSDGSCVSVDLVIVVDQSLSMYGSREMIATDPDVFRQEATQLLITELLINQLFECPDSRHRWSVIYFGGTDSNPGERIVVQQAMTDFDDLLTEPLDLNAIKTFVTGLQQSIVEPVAAMQGTDPRLAMDRAIDDLFSIERIPAEEEVKKAIVIITDGDPCASSTIYPGSRYSFGCSVIPPNTLPSMNQVSLTEYMNSLLLETWQTSYQGQIGVYLLPINTTSEYLERRTDSEDFPTLYDYWNEITGGKIYPVIRTGLTVTKAVTEISQDLLGTGETFDLPCSNNHGRFFMPPFQDQAEIIILKESENDTFELSHPNPDGTEVTILNGTVSEPENGADPTMSIYLPIGRSEIYRFKPPYPGEWNFSSSDCEKMSVRFTPIYITPELVTPSRPVNVFPVSPYYDTTNPLVYQVNLGGQNPEAALASLSTIPITVTLEVYPEANPERIISPIYLQPNPDNPTLFESQAPNYVLTPLADTYIMSVTGMFTAPGILDPTRMEEYKIFNQATFTFLAKELIEFGLERLGSVTLGPWPLNTVELDRDIPQSYDIEFALTLPNVNNFDYRTAGISSDFEITLESSRTTLANRSGNLSLTPEPDGTFSFKFPPDGLIGAPTSSYTLTVKFIGAYDDQVYYLRQDTQTVTFNAYTVTGIQPEAEVFPAPSEINNIYTNCLSACPLIGGSPTPLNLRVTFQERVNGELIPVTDPTTFDKWGIGDPANYLTATLVKVDEDTQAEEDVIKDLHFNLDGYQFVLTEPIEEISEAGIYRFKIAFNIPADQEFDRGYALISDQERSYTFPDVEFTRQDARPGICGGIMIGSALIVILLIILYAYLRGGPMRGWITIAFPGVTESTSVAGCGGINRLKGKKFRSKKLLDKAGISLVETRLAKMDSTYYLRVLTYDGENNILDNNEIDLTEKTTTRPLSSGQSTAIVGLLTYRK